MAVNDPWSSDRDPNVRVVDHGHETPVPRAWFETRTVPRDTALVEADWKAFFAGLDPSTNPYLVPADELRAKGFVGAPYTVA